MLLRGEDCMKKKIVIIAAVICVLITGISIGNKINLDARNNTNSLKISTSVATNKTVTKSKAQIDSERPDKLILKPKDKGEDVIRIQTRLKVYGYNINIDGDYGAGTVYAVMNFQHTNNLEISGTVSGETLDALYKIPTKESVYKPATQSMLTANEVSTEAAYESTINSTQSISNTNNFILVNLSEQRVYIFYGTNHNWKLINTFSCASGRPETPTIQGHFLVGVKGLYFKSGETVYCKYFTQISGNYLFHSILFDKNGNVLDSSLGAVASHGCIRLALQNAKYIFDNIPIGSGIWIK